MKKRAIATLWRLYHARSDTIIWRHAVCARTLIPLYHGRETRSGSFTSYRDRVNIFGGNKDIFTSTLPRAKFQKNEIQQLKAIK